MTLSVFLVDEDALYRAGFRLVVEHAEAVAVVGEATTTEEAQAAILRSGCKVDVLVLGIANAGACADAIREITADGTKSTRVLVVSSSDTDEAVVTAVRAGAQGYVTKGLSADELLRAIQVVADGGAVFCAAVAARLCVYFSALQDYATGVAFPSLSDRERQILEFIAMGCDNRHIARRLVLSEKTVRNHTTRLFRKLEVTDRMSAAMRARDAGIGLHDRIPGVTRPVS